MPSGDNGSDSGYDPDETINIPADGIEPDNPN